MKNVVCAQQFAFVFITVYVCQMYEFMCSFLFAFYLYYLIDFYFTMGLTSFCVPFFVVCITSTALYTLCEFFFYWGIVDTLFFCVCVRNVYDRCSD